MRHVARISPHYHIIHAHMSALIIIVIHPAVIIIIVLLGIMFGIFVSIDRYSSSCYYVWYFCFDRSMVEIVKNE